MGPGGVRRRSAPEALDVRRRALRVLALLILLAPGASLAGPPADPAVALVEKLAAHHAYTALHSRHVGAYAEYLAARLKRPAREVARARRAGMLHDLGKLQLDVAILDKPGKPAPDEWAQIQQHPARGAQLAEAAGIEGPVALGVRGHHERWDGNGYPARLKGESIPLIARIVSVADVWDAVTTDRSYQKARPFGEAMRVLRAAAGSQLDPALVDAFLADETALKRLHDRLRMP